MNSWNPAEIMERLLALEAKINAIPEPETVEANPEGEATVDLAKLLVGETIYGIPEGGGMPDLSTTETLTGRTFLGSPTYIAVIYFNGSQQVNSNLAWYTMPITMPSGINNIVDITIKFFSGGVIEAMDCQLADGSLQFRNHSQQNQTFTTSDYIIIEYTKASSQAKKSTKKKNEEEK